MPGRTYSPDFKLDLVRQVEAGGKSKAQLCREHDLSPTLVHRWQQQYEKHGEAAFDKRQPLRLIGVNDLWDIVFTKKPGHEGLGGVSIAVPLEENIEHEAVLVYRPPEPVTDAIDTRTHFIQVPPGTPPGFPVAQFFREQGPEFDAPLAERLVADLDAALVEQFLDVSVAQWEAVVQPDGVLDDAYREAVAVGFEVGHGRSAYPDRVKATQPTI